MTEKILADPRLYELLQRIDGDLAEGIRAGGCAICAGLLHSARYPRKPRGGPVGLGARYDWRLSFCCAEEGCRKRATPPSVRFLGRKVYLGAVLVVVTALQHGPTPWRLSRLRELCGASFETVKRWRAWWQETFTQTHFWRAARGSFARPVVEAALPASLLERFAGSEEARLVGLLRFVAPITTSSGIATLAEGQR